MLLIAKGLDHSFKDNSTKSCGFFKTSLISQGVVSFLLMGLCIFFASQNHGGIGNLIKLRSTIQVSCFSRISTTGEIILMKILNLVQVVVRCYFYLSCQNFSSIGYHELVCL